MWNDGLTLKNQQKIRNFHKKENQELSSGLHTFAQQDPEKYQEWFKNTPFKYDLPWDRTIRAPLAGQKIGVTSFFDPVYGDKQDVTMIHVPETHVIRYFNRNEYNGKSAGVVIGSKNTSPLSKNDIYTEYCRKAGVPTKAYMYEGEITEDAGLLPGTRMHVGHFKPGQRVNATATTIGYGHLDPMARWHMSGGRALDRGGFKRKQGAISTQGLKRVLPGTKMGGQVGNMLSKHPELRVLKINYKEQIIYLQGNIAGHINSWVLLEDNYVRDRRDWVSEDPKLHTKETIPLVPTDFRDVTNPDLFPAENISKFYYEYTEKPLNLK